MKSVGSRTTKATLKATRNYSLYSLHFHSIITSDEKQRIPSSTQIINIQSSHFTNQIPTFQCNFPIYAGNLLQG
uniref:Uncharacterized protein n=1 Tax=Rhinopithecus bieti TaxID=61621 RepID=A0A2K6M4W8_RHIBE